MSDNLLSIPANTQAEAAVLGSILIDPYAISKVDDILIAADFFVAGNQEIYRVLCSLSAENQPIDYISVNSRLEDDQNLELVGGPARITQLITATASSLHIRHYAELVKDASTRRAAIAVAGDLAEMAYDTTMPTGDVLNVAQAKILELGFKESRDTRDIRQLTADVVDRIGDMANDDNAVVGLPTGFALLDNVLGGLQRSDLMILAARPGMGKTSLALSIAQRAVNRQNASIGIFSLEMSNEQIVQRLLSMQSGINAHNLRTGEVSDDEWPQLMTAADTISKTTIAIDDTPALTIAELRSKTRRMHAENPLDLLIVDYLQLMSGAGGTTVRAENRQQEISYISRSLKALARELNVPLIALSQLSRAVEARADKTPFLSDLRESGSLEQDADIVLFIYREDYYLKETDRANIADLIIAKHRHGAVGTVSLFFDKEKTLFMPLDIKQTSLAY